MMNTNFQGNDPWVFKQAVEDLPANFDGKDLFGYLSHLRLDLGNDPVTYPVAEQDSLVAYAERNGLGAAFAAGLLLGEAAERAQQPVYFPGDQRAMVHNANAANAEQAAVLLHLFPSPANDHVVLTYPLNLAGRECRVLDAGGRVVLNTTLNALGAQELGTSGLTDGVYTLTVMGCDQPARFVIIQ